MFKYDSTHGVYPGAIVVESEDTISIDGHKIKVPCNDPPHPKVYCSLRMQGNVHHSSSQGTMLGNVSSRSRTLFCSSLFYQEIEAHFARYRLQAAWPRGRGAWLARRALSERAPCQQHAVVMVLVSQC